MTDAMARFSLRFTAGLISEQKRVKLCENIGFVHTKWSAAKNVTERRLCGSYSTGFDKSLVETLRYNAPALLAAAVGRALDRHLGPWSSKNRTSAPWSRNHAGRTNPVFPHDLRRFWFRNALLL